VQKPKPGKGQLLVRVSTCAVCRTDLHVVDGELPNPKLPLILGHQIVGRVEEIGEENSNFAIGDRVGIPWLGWTDGDCAYCRSGRENLCDNARFTGYTIDGGYAEFTVADGRFTKGANCSCSRVRATQQHNKPQENLARFGPAAPTRCHRKDSMPRLSLHRSARSFLRRCARSPRAAS